MGKDYGKYSVATKIKNTNKFAFCESFTSISLTLAETHVQVLISQCGRTYEDIRIYKDIDFSTQVKINAYDERRQEQEK